MRLIPCYSLALSKGWDMEETFQARWRNAVVGICLTAAIFGAGPWPKRLENLFGDRHYRFSTGLDLSAEAGRIGEVVGHEEARSC